MTRVDRLASKPLPVDLRPSDSVRSQRFVPRSRFLGYIIEPENHLKRTRDGKRPPGKPSGPPVRSDGAEQNTTPQQITTRAPER
eukprot:3254759-Pyramimonas_sp.AAC.1